MDLDVERICWLRWCTSWRSRTQTSWPSSRSRRRGRRECSRSQSLLTLKRRVSTRWVNSVRFQWSRCLGPREWLSSTPSQVIVEARDRASQGEVNTAQATILVQVDTRSLSPLPSPSWSGRGRWRSSSWVGHCSSCHQNSWGCRGLLTGKIDHDHDYDDEHDDALDG